MSPSTQHLFPANSRFSETDWRVLSKFWHPVATSEEADNGPFSTVLLDVRVVVFRDAGARAVAALDICPHRGAQLGRGKVVGGELQCPYHGLRFDGTGRCTAIPAQDPSTRIPERMRIQVFQTIERYGLVWALLNDELLCDLPDWSALEAEGIGWAPVPPETWDVTAARHAENFNDVSHLAFVHQDTFGDIPAMVPDYELEQGDGVLRHHYRDLGNSRLFERHIVDADREPDLIETCCTTTALPFRSLRRSPCLPRMGGAARSLT